MGSKSGSSWFLICTVIVLLVFLAFRVRVGGRGCVTAGHGCGGCATSTGCQSDKQR